MTKEWIPAGHDPRVKVFLLTRNPRVMGVRVTRVKLIKKPFI